MANESRVQIPREFIQGLEPELLRELAASVRGVLNGHTNNYYSVELVPGQTETVVSVEYARSTGIANFCPTSEAAAIEMSSGTIWTTVENGQFTVHHESDIDSGLTLGVTLAG